MLLNWALGYLNKLRLPVLGSYCLAICLPHEVRTFLAREDGRT